MQDRAEERELVGRGFVVIENDATKEREGSGAVVGEP
jgi:hypothetical protein